jgi:hypothetical protein
MGRYKIQISLLPETEEHRQRLRGGVEWRPARRAATSPLAEDVWQAKGVRLTLRQLMGSVEIEARKCEC